MLLNRLIGGVKVGGDVALFTGETIVQAFQHNGTASCAKTVQKILMPTLMAYLIYDWGDKEIQYKVVS